jgi:hypothetical protein
MSSNPPRPAEPSKEIFDPFNSSATGHQRPENRLSGSTLWCDSRSLKLKNQFRSGAGGGKRVSDTVGAGSLDFGQDGRTASGGWEKGAKGLRTGGQRSLFESLKVDKEVERPTKRAKTNGSKPEPTTVVNPYTPFRKADGTIRETSWTSHERSPSHLLSPIDPNISFNESQGTGANDNAEDATTANETPLQVFANLNIYVNGSTAPLISDHKLKHMLTRHGAGISIALRRRTVTHVIIGRPSSSGGSGGGLSGSKLHKEISKTGGNNIKYVTAEWVLESVEAGKRLPESKFAALSIAPKGVMSVASMFGRRQGGHGDTGMKDDGG